jgi:hypothetical protein
MSYFLFLHTGIVLVRLFVAVAMHEGNKGERISFNSQFQRFQSMAGMADGGKERSANLTAVRKQKAETDKEGPRPRSPSQARLIAHG